MTVRVKLCGLSREEDIRCVNGVLPDYIGFMFYEKSRRFVSPERAAALRKLLRPEIRAVGVFVNRGEEEILRIAEMCSLDLVQLHGAETPEFVSRIRRGAGLSVVKAVSMTEGGSGAPLSVWENSDADFLLLDNGKGGTGTAFDHSAIGRVRKPFFLAGGLNASNVRESVLSVRPYAVDVSSGIETNGVKDPAKITEIMEIIRRIENE